MLVICMCIDENVTETKEHSKLNYLSTPRVEENRADNIRTEKHDLVSLAYSFILKQCFAHIYYINFNSSQIEKKKSVFGKKIRSFPFPCLFIHQDSNTAVFIRWFNSNVSIPSCFFSVYLSDF